jgi:hypothetical protein
MLMKKGVLIAPASTYDACLPVKTGAQVAEDLGGRLLIRYLRRTEVNAFLSGNSARHWVTPTPLGSNELVTWLNLPDPLSKRCHLLLLRPEHIPEILGPRWVEGGLGIEYILPNGFPRAALVFGWALEVK